MSASAEAPPPASLRSRRGVLVLLLLCSVQFLDILDSSIMNVALPSIQRDLHFDQQSLQWVLSGYILSYGGFLLLGGRLADLFGRRRVLAVGLTLFASCSLAGGLAPNAGTLVGARIAQGLGAALMAPAALSIVTTTFRDARDRTTALGVWGAVSGLAGAAGVLFGGLLSSGPGWRWVLFVNLPVCLLALVFSFRLLAPDAGTDRRAGFDLPGAVLATGGMLLLVHALIEAPDRGWGTARTVGELATAGLLLLGLALNERRHRAPLVPPAVFRIKGLAAADATGLIGFAGFYSMFFFVTLYMQNVLGYSPIKAGSAYVPVTAGIAIAAGISTKLFPRVGTRPVTVTGALLAAAGIYLLSRIPLHGTYAADLMPGLLLMSLGLGAVFVSVTTAANAGVPERLAGLAAGLMNTSQQLGAALGLAVFSALATARTHDLFAAGAAAPAALTGGYRRALLAASVFLLAAAVIALRTARVRGETALDPDSAGSPDPTDDAAPADRPSDPVSLGGNR
ncbi:MAG TPA: MFS transporter [Actinocrinis sp.]|nr:MFS transporter [Actinocrinis sp.]